MSSLKAIWQGFTWGVTSLAATTSIIVAQVVDLSVEGLKRSYAYVAPNLEAAVTSRIIRGPESQVSYAIEERSESPDGSVKRRRVVADEDNRVKKDVRKHLPITSNLHDRKSPRQDRKSEAAWDFGRQVKQESMAAQPIARPKPNAKHGTFNIKLPATAHYKSNYDLMNSKPFQTRVYQSTLSGLSHRRPVSPSQKSTETFRKKPENFDATVHRKTQADKISTHEKYAQERAARKLRAQETSRHQEQLTAAQKAQESAKEERERQELERCRVQLRADEKAKAREATNQQRYIAEEQACMEARRQASALQYQEEAAREEEAELIRQAQTMRKERYEIQRDRQEAHLRRQEGAENEKEEQRAYTERQSAFLEEYKVEISPPDWKSLVRENRRQAAYERKDPPIYWSPENQARMKAIQSQTLLNTNFNQLYSRLNYPKWIARNPGNGVEFSIKHKSHREVQFALSPNSGLPAVAVKQFQKTLPSHMLEDSQESWNRQKEFHSRWTDRDLFHNHRHPPSIPTRASYGLERQYDDPPDIQDGASVFAEVTQSVEVEMTEAPPNSADLITPSVTPTIKGALDASFDPLTHSSHGTTMNEAVNYFSAVPATTGSQTHALLSGGVETPSTNGLQAAAASSNEVKTTSANSSQEAATVVATSSENTTTDSSQIPVSEFTEEVLTTGSNGSNVTARSDPTFVLDHFLDGARLSGLSLGRVLHVRAARKAALEAEEAARKAEEEQRRKAAEAEEAARAKAAEEEAKAKAVEEDRLKGGRRMPKEKFVQELSAAWASRLNGLQREGVKVKTPGGVDLRQKDFDTLGSGCWLNDEIINAYLEQIVDEANKLAGKQKFVTMNSFFYSTLSQNEPSKVARWMKRKKAGGEKMLELEAVFIPVNQNSHWTLIVVSPQAKTIEYLDSFGGSSRVFVNNIRRWLAMELGSKYVAREWTVPNTACARQYNGYDCGVFLVTNAKCVSLGLDLTCYNANDMEAQRRRIAAELLNGGSITD